MSSTSITSRSGSLANNDLSQVPHSINLSINSFDISNEVESAVEQECLGIALELLASESYVSVELPNSDVTLHITRSLEEEGRINVHAVQDAFTPGGYRYTSIEERAFLKANEDLAPSEGLNVQSLLRQAYDFVRLRYDMPHIVEVERQGFYERGPQQDLGLVDTGGETLYVEKQSQALAELGFVVTVVNQGGCEHPTNKDVRQGMHYKRDFVDLLFVNDGEHSFVKKEDTSPVYDFNQKDENGDPVILKEGIYQKLAIEAERALGSRKIDGIIGHYLCGAAVGYELYKLREDTDKPVPSLPVFLAHSLGEVKRRRVGAEETQALNLDRRIETERRYLQKPDLLVVTVSNELTRSVEEDYNGKVHGFCPAGIDPDVFYPRPPSVSKSDARYEELWMKLARARFNVIGHEVLSHEGKVMNLPKNLSELSRDDYQHVKDVFANHISFMQSCTIITETSRTVSTKGKDGTLRAFAEVLKNSSDKNVLLITNIADPDPAKIEDPDELAHVRHLHALVDELGIRKNIVFQPTFENSDVALIGQIADIYHSDAKMETWGMSAQQAVCVELLLICSESIPIAKESLAGKVSTHETTEDGYTLTQGCVLHPSGDYEAAASAMLRYIQDQDPAWKIKVENMIRHGYDKGRETTWAKATRNLTESVGFQYKQGEGSIDYTFKGIRSNARSIGQQ